MKKYSALLLTLLFLGCSSGSDKPDPQPTDDGKDRSVMLKALAENVIIPSYDQFKAKFDLMAEKSKAFTAKPDAQTLSDFRSAWAGAYVAWERVELFDFGPGEKETIRNFFNIYPASEAGITANITDPAVGDPTLAARTHIPATRPMTIRAIPAINRRATAEKDQTMYFHQTRRQKPPKSMASSSGITFRSLMLETSLP